MNDPIAESHEAVPAVLADENPTKPEPGLALCLSGGGTRAELFHVGAILRLNELGLLSKLNRVSSVSGGSITAGVLGLAWNRFSWSHGHVSESSLQELFVNPCRAFASTNVDVSAVGWGVLSPWSTINDEVAAAYDRVLFHGATLQDLPDEVPPGGADPIPAPRFVINATNVKTGSLWRFAKPYMADYRVGIVERPRVPLARAVAASSAFPPFLSPMHLSLDHLVFKPGIPDASTEESLRSLRGEAILSDGGIYDNLGLEPVWKRYETVLVSDGGRKMSDDLSPATDWARHSRRLIDLLQHQVSNLRRRELIGAFTDPQSPRPGTYWGIQTDITKYPAGSKLPCDFRKTQSIANIETRLAALPERDQDRIINWGYAVCDAAIRSHLPAFSAAVAPTRFPNSGGVEL